VRPISDFVYEVEHLLTGNITQQHVVRTRFYADHTLDLPVKLLDEIKAEDQIQNVYDIEDILDYKFDTRRNVHLFQCKWMGFSTLENTWEDLTVVHDSVPALLHAFLAKLPEGPSHTALRHALDGLTEDSVESDAHSEAVESDDDD
jgi:hypothetical protein